MGNRLSSFKDRLIGREFGVLPVAATLSGYMTKIWSGLLILLIDCGRFFRFEQRAAVMLRDCKQ
jgi:hypothetical protein